MKSVFDQNQNKAGLLLSDGSFFPGTSVGYEAPEFPRGIFGEVVFNTAMSGYQEILTDPSYYGQIVVMTYPHIGNYGINAEDWESPKFFAAGLIMHELCEVPSNWRTTKSLAAALKEQKIPALSGVDTRALTRHIRDKGAMNAYIVNPAPLKGAARETLLQQLKTEPSFGEQDLVAKVTCKEAHAFVDAGLEMSQAWNQATVIAKDSPVVALLDMGAKNNMARALVRRGCKVKVFPSHASAQEILASGAKGLLLSNGPGDPATVAAAPKTVSQLLGKLPIFGICMGHQILGQAIGAKTFKMKFGHHGANQPVLDLESGRVVITSQNHGYAIDPETLPKNARVSQRNLNDQSVEGIELPEHKAFSVQYHPEACPGPRDAMFLFDKFMRAMGYV